MFRSLLWLSSRCRLEERYGKIRQTDIRKTIVAIRKFCERGYLRAWKYWSPIKFLVPVILIILISVDLIILVNDTVLMQLDKSHLLSTKRTFIYIHG
jgi:hypothetical protein